MVPTVFHLTIFIILKVLGWSEGFVLKTQVNLPEPRLTELQEAGDVQPKLIKALYEVVFLVDGSNSPSSRSAFSPPLSFHTDLLPHQQPKLLKVEPVTESLVKKDEDDVPVIKGYDPDQTQHLVEALDEIKKQTDLKVKVDMGAAQMGRSRGWSTPWRPLARSEVRPPDYGARYSPGEPCCPPDPSHPSWRH